MASPSARNEFLRVLEDVRQQYLFTVVGYVVMPEHFHLLISEPTIKDPSAVMFSLKKRTAHNLLTGMRQLGHATAPEHFWQKRFYDFNVWTAKKVAGEVGLYAPQPREARIGATSRRLALEQ